MDFNKVGNKIEEVVKTEPLSEITKAKQINFSLSSNIIASEKNGMMSKSLSTNYMNIVPEDRSDRFYSNKNIIHVTNDNSNNYERIYSSTSNTQLMGTGTIRNAIGYSGSLAIGNQQNISAYGAGILGSNYIAGRGNISSLYGVFGRNMYYSKGITVESSMSGFFTSSMPHQDN